jgi:hypothetical protein
MTCDVVKKEKKFNKSDMSRDVNMAREEIKATKTFMFIRVTKKHVGDGSGG